MLRKPTDEELARRYTYRHAEDEQIGRYQQIHDKALEFATLMRDLTPCSPEQTLAINTLDKAAFLAEAAIGRHE